MKTDFYKRTAYLFLPIETPDCFLKLDEYFDEKISDSSEASIAKILEHPLVKIAENLSYRMADIDLYAVLIDDLIQNNHEFWSKESVLNQHIDEKAIFVKSLLISLYSSYKSLFDAGAIALNQLYSLELKDKEQDFRKGKFLELLTSRGKPDYTDFRPLVNKIIKWRDSCIHRVPPTVITIEEDLIHNSSDNRYNISLFGKMEKGSNMIGDPTTLGEIIKALENNDAQTRSEIGFSELLDHHKEWRRECINFCGLVCDDIKKAEFPNGYIIGSWLQAFETDL